MSRAEIRFAQRALPTDERLVKALRKAGVVHADETGWRVSRRNAWLWVFASKDITISAIRFRRGHEVHADMLDENLSARDEVLLRPTNGLREAVWLSSIEH